MLAADAGRESAVTYTEQDMKIARAQGAHLVREFIAEVGANAPAGVDQFEHATGLVAFGIVHGLVETLLAIGLPREHVHRHLACSLQRTMAEQGG